MRGRPAFTLIELLVVIALIGLVATVILVNVNTARARARDARRMVELRSFMTALQAFYSEHGVYPCGDSDSDGIPGTNNPGGTADTPAGCNPNEQANVSGFLNGCLAAPGVCSWTASNCSSAPLDGLFAAGYLKTNCPKDPVNKFFSNGNYKSYWYTVSADRQKYILAAQMEGGKEMMADDGGTCSQAYEVGNAVGELGVHSILYGC